ncbi:lipid A disaccharide synthase [Chondrocystis sp. NIES-4102]|nr:lipid A disaccharide synthase [Chondrocystis sp. NIES-4102]
MKIFISTGEVSGDLQAAMLIKSLYQVAATKNIPLTIAGLGGDRMKAAGAEIIAHTDTIGSMGLIEALPFVTRTIKIQTFTKKYLQANLPDILIIVDYPTPNLALAGYVKKHFPHIPIVYYIAPQDWAVPMLNNVPKITQVVDKLLAVFPAEAQYFTSKGINVTWVGHPLLDRMQAAPNREQARQDLKLPLDAQIITLLPASRQQEIKYLLPVMCEAAQKIVQQMPNVQFLIPLSLSNYRPKIEAAIEQYNIPAQIIADSPIKAIAAADVAITKSGTVNLEIALLNVPQVVIYRVHPLTAWIYLKLLRFSIPLMSPTNLILNKKLVPELQQEAVTADNIATQTLHLLTNDLARKEIIAGYQQMRSLLGNEGVCNRAATEILNL